MASIGQGHRDSDATAYESGEMNNVSEGNGRRILENPLVTPEKGQAKRKGDEEAQVVVDEKNSVSDSTIKVYVWWCLHDGVAHSSHSNPHLQ